MKQSVYRYIFILTLSLVAPLLVFASTSTNYAAYKEHAGPVNFHSTSTNYDFYGEVGHPGAGDATSTNYIIGNGTYWDDQVEASIKWAVPELRVGATSTNDDAIFYLTIRSPQDNDNTILYSTPLIASTTASGQYAAQIPLPGMQPGIYDVGIKAHQHLTKILQNVMLTSGMNVLNFTQPNNISTYGLVRLLAGDINGATSSSAVMGDDTVNSIDLLKLVQDLDNNDPTGNDRRSNLNQDIVTNSVDLSILLKNLDKMGDR